MNRQVKMLAFLLAGRMLLEKLAVSKRPGVYFNRLVRWETFAKRVMRAGSLDCPCARMLQGCGGSQRYGAKKLSVADDILGLMFCRCGLGRCGQVAKC
jgi:hypothetical protein